MWLHHSLLKARSDLTITFLLDIEVVLILIADNIAFSLLIEKSLSTSVFILLGQFPRGEITYQMGFIHMAKEPLKCAPFSFHW